VWVLRRVFVRYIFKNFHQQGWEEGWSSSSTFSCFYFLSITMTHTSKTSVLMITLGAVIAYAIGAGFFHVKSGWRWMVGLGSIPAAIQFLLLFLLPESRRLTSYAQHTHINDPTFFLFPYSPHSTIQKKCFGCSRSHVQDLCKCQPWRHRPQGTLSFYSRSFLNTLLNQCLSPDESPQYSCPTIHLYETSYNLLRPL